MAGCFGRTTPRPARLPIGVTGRRGAGSHSDMSAEDADTLTATDPYVHAGVATYERVSFNAGFRAEGP